ncbi:winged helix-turn-helix transcriptional regulator [Cognatishimia maritima]|uniref:Transcriptional regulator, HxlR family n=1 Tax=Cognatishimia maritima TaxID=870908 RepID=A0A1M5VJZ3_9RHOB|nr:helix-turn-helix domain-containing protein [Cognatishimia maritima]SHH75527.1 transcriptional regulator, HxlR family [Cognatishimia maritima]
MSSNACPVDPLLRTITGRWTTYILWMLFTEGPLRFGELMGLMPDISAKVLTERLRMLERNGIVLRTQLQTIPPQVSYELTEQGRALNDVIRALNAVAVEWQSIGWEPDKGFPESLSADTAAE